MWDERYRAEEYAYGTQANDFLAQNYTRLAKGNILCLADGEGRNSVFLAQKGYTITAVDSSIEGISKARKLAELNKVNVDYIHADLGDYDLGVNKWDGIVSVFCHLPPDIRAKVHHQVVSSLKPRGVLLLEAYTPEQLQLGTGGPTSPELTMTAKSLTSELSGLNFEELIELERDVVEGLYHTGHAAVVQAIAIKE